MLRVLLIDSNRERAAQTAQSLTEDVAAWAEIHICPGGEDAFRMLADLKADAVLLDQTTAMPNPSQFITLLRETRPRAPVLIMADASDTQASVLALRWGAGDFIVRQRVPPSILKRLVCAAVEREVLTTKSDTGSDAARRDDPDPLTGLWGRRAFRDRLLQEMFRSERYGAPLSLLALDLDHFRRLNATYGREAGDAVLKTAARVIRESIRLTDVAARVGADEFAVLLIETPAMGAVRYANKLLQAFRIREHRPSGTGTPFQVTCSIGIAEFVPELLDTPAFLKRAEKALDEAVMVGRNRYCIASGEKMPVQTQPKPR